MKRGDDCGSITAFVAVIATALVLVAGMAYDGGQVIAAHQATRSLAARGARVSDGSGSGSLLGNACGASRFG